MRNQRFANISRIQKVIIIIAQFPLLADRDCNNK